MNRREALAALTSLPAAAVIQRANVEHSDVIVVTVPGLLSTYAMENIRLSMKAVWPNNRCVVLCDGANLSIVKGENLT